MTNEGKQAPTTTLTPKMMLELAAPHTWPAAILPCLIAFAAAAASQTPLSLTLCFSLLSISILMQAATNTFNDYYDFIKGTDDKDADVAADDAVLVYNNVNPRAALILACSLLAAAFFLGVYVIYCAGFFPLIWGIIGAIFVVIYSAGKTPISYLPLGELISGLVMGGLIFVASYQALTGILSPLLIPWALPTIIGVGLIMLTNNTCDIERDTLSQRSTLPIKLGRKEARALYHALLLLWLLVIILNVVTFFHTGWPILVFMLLASYPLIKPLWANPLAADTRQAAMAQICTLNVVLGAFYAAAIFAHAGLILLCF